MIFRSIFAATICLLMTSTAFADAVTVRDSVRAYRQANERAILEEYVELLSIPNVASDTENIHRNAKYIEAMLEMRGVSARLLTMPGVPPVVYGELLQPAADTTVMIYVHYDGQPVQRENWASEPWDPVLRSGVLNEGGEALKIDEISGSFDPEWRLYARSTGDDKAPIVGLMTALDALREAGQASSINLKFFFEGEEEAGSPHLAEYLALYAHLLAADLWLFCDGPVHQTRRNQLAFGVRGITSFDVTVYGPTRQLHSGHYGNWAPNPIARLAHLITSMRDADGHVSIEGFYDKVIPPTSTELEAIASAPNVDAMLQHELGLGETESPGMRLEEAILQPALNLKGIRAGDVGAAARNAIVDQATATFGIRMVPAQTPDGLRLVVEEHIKNEGYHIVRDPPSLEVLREYQKVARVHWSEHGYPSVRFSMDDPLSRELVVLLNEVVDEPLVTVPTMGGSLPLHIFQSRLDTPIILFPIANHDNNQHANNENIRLQNLWTAIELYAVIIAEYGNRLRE